MIHTPLAALVAGALVLAACGSDDEPAAEEPAVAAPDDDMSDDMSDDMADDDMSDDMGSMNDLMSTITGQTDLTTLDAAIHAADLQDTLHDGGPFTVFAPTDAAFAAYLGEMDMTAEDVLADVDALTVLLQAHVVQGAQDSTAVVELDGRSVTTLAGDELAISVDGDTVRVGDATVTEVDLTADNGVVHVIDTVLTPPAS